ncbi:MAG: hypothetical protein HYW63_00210 [Candidatus Levybacteria bacterium]|nr:hypothetical protein [Candidatus Levybacteria bacterium]
MSEQRTGSTQEGPTQRPKDLPIPPAIDAIKQRLTGEIQMRKLHGTALTEEDRILRDAEESPTWTGRSEEILSEDIPGQRTIINSTIINLGTLKSWMDTTGLKEFDDGTYYLETDQVQIRPIGKTSSDLRTIELTLSLPEFDINYVYYQDGTFDLHIDFTEYVEGIRPAYRSGRNPIRTDMTLEEAEIMGAYALDFIDRTRTIQRPAA